jgi:hypothetical protein
MLVALFFIVFLLSDSVSSFDGINRKDANRMLPLSPKSYKGTKKPDLRVSQLQSRVHPDSTDPALFLKSLFEYVGNFLGDLFGPALNRAFAALLAVNYYPTADDKSHWVMGGN